VIVQCPACRALVAVTALVKLDDDGGAPHVGVPCAECGAISPLVVGPAAAMAASASPSSSAPLAPAVPPPASVHASAPTPTTPGAANDDAAAPSTPPSTSPPSSLAPPIAPTLARVLDEATRALASAESDVQAAAARARTSLVDGLTALGDRWESKDAHKALVGEAARQGELAFLGQCYRAISLARPDDKGAVVGRDLVLAHAMATMSTSVGDSDALLATAKKVRTVAVVLGAIALVATLAFLIKSVGESIAELGLGGASSSGAPE